MSKKFKVTGFHPMKAVYTFMFPECFAACQAVSALITRDFYRVTTPVERAQQLLDGLITPPLKLPGTKAGMLDLDELHVPVIERMITAYATQVPALGKFAWRYPGAGSSEGLFHLLTRVKMIHGQDKINVIAGEYEGYGAQAGNLKMGCTQWRMDDPALDKLAPGWWFISNPSATNGNVLPNEFLQKLLDRGHQVVLDLAYVGATAPRVFDVSHENVRAVVMSFSKPYGVFRQRIGGFIFSREEVPSLYGSKWFKDVERQLQAAKLAVDIGPSTLFSKYRPVQEAIIAALNETYGLGMQAADTLLIANLSAANAAALPADKLPLIEQFKRGDWYRFCLTPYLEQADDQGLLN